MNRPFSFPLYVARRSGEHGFTLVSAIFILVVLAVLGATVVTVSTSQQRGAAADILGTRAYAAARAGVEWGMFQVNNSNNFSTANTVASLNSRTCPASAVNSFALPASAPTLSGFTVTVTCTAYPDTHGGLIVYQIDAVACNAPLAGWAATATACPGTLGINYVERRMRASL